MIALPWFDIPSPAPAGLGAAAPYDGKPVLLAADLADPLAPHVHVQQFVGAWGQAPDGTWGFLLCRPSGDIFGPGPTSGVEEVTGALYWAPARKGPFAS